jgi:hypothetical protein
MARVTEGGAARTSTLVRMADPTPPASSPATAPPDAMFPILTPAQIGRIAAHGRTRQVAAEEVLMEPGDPSVRIVVVTAGHVEIGRPSGADPVVAVLGPG